MGGVLATTSNLGRCSGSQGSPHLGTLWKHGFLVCYAKADNYDLRRRQVQSISR